MEGKAPIPLPCPQLGIKARILTCGQSTWHLNLKEKASEVQTLSRMTSTAVDSLSGQPPSPHPHTEGIHPRGRPVSLSPTAPRRPRKEGHMPPADRPWGAAALRVGIGTRQSWLPAPGLRLEGRGAAGRGRSENGAWATDRPEESPEKLTPALGKGGALGAQEDAEMGPGNTPLPVQATHLFLSLSSPRASEGPQRLRCVSLTPSRPQRSFSRVGLRVPSRVPEPPRDFHEAQGPSGKPRQGWDLGPRSAARGRGEEETGRE